MKSILLKLSILSSIALILSSCDNQTHGESLVPGRIADTKWFFHNGDTLLWVYSLFSSEHQEYSSSSIDKTSTYSHENSLFTLLRLKNNQLSYVYQKEAECINHQKCGSRYTDKIIAFSSGLLAFNCYCEGKLSIIDIPTGKEWSDLRGLKTKFKECSSGITKYGTFPARPDVLELELSDGTVAYLSLEDKRMIGWDKSFDDNGEVNKGCPYTEDSGRRIYFAPNDGDHRAFLVVRTIKSGTSQDYKYRTGESYWLNPILVNRINRTDAYVKDDAFFVLHSKTWNEYQDRDMLSKVNTKGETLYSIDIKGLGDISSYVPSTNYLYMTNKDGLHIYDVVSGQKISFTAYNSVKAPESNTSS